MFASDCRIPTNMMNFICVYSVGHYRSNHTTRICWIFAVDLLADRLYSKSPANLQHIRCVASKSTTSVKHFSTNGFVCNILTCRYVADKSVVSPANPFDVIQNGQIYSKSTACRFAVDKSVASPASLQQVASKSPANPCSMFSGLLPGVRYDDDLNS